MDQAAARHDGKGAIIVCLAPDVCLTPMGNSMVPVPYMVISMLSWSTKTVTNVLFQSLQAFTMASRTEKVTGDEAGTGGGIKSGVNRGFCRPKSNKTSFFVNGHEVIQNDNLYEMNCAGPNGLSNTIGRLVYFEPTAAAEAEEEANELLSSIAADLLARFALSANKVLNDVEKRHQMGVEYLKSDPQLRETAENVLAKAEWEAVGAGVGAEVGGPTGAEVSAIWAEKATSYVIDFAAAMETVSDVKEGNYYEGTLKGVKLASSVFLDETLGVDGVPISPSDVLTVAAASVTSYLYGFTVGV